MNIRKSAAAAALLSLILSLLPLQGKALVFDPNSVLTDRTIRDCRSMDLWQISSFLRQKGGLGDIRDTDPIDGIEKDAAQLIYDAAWRYEVNPMYILALLQKESSVVETARPSQRQLDFAAGYGICDSCAADDPIAQKNRGLARQIDAGAGFVEWFWNEGIRWPTLPKPGQPSRISGLTVVPSNTATAALYAYTPHLHGNRLLLSVWKRWWGEVGEEAGFPDGSLVRNEKTGQIGLIQNGRLRPIASLAVLRSRFGAVSPISINEYEYAILAESRGEPVRLPEPSLVRTEDGALWLLVNGKRRPIASAAAFARIGFSPEELEDVRLAEIADYPVGAALTAASASAAGYLARDPRSGGVWWVENEERHALHDPALLKLAFAGEPWRAMTAAEIDRIPLGEAARFPDGVLLKVQGDPTVFVVSAGRRRPIASETAFISLGYRWTDIHTVSARSLSVHLLGEPLNIAR